MVLKQILTEGNGQATQCSDSGVNLKTTGIVGKMLILSDLYRCFQAVVGRLQGRFRFRAVGISDRRVRTSRY